MHTLSLTGRCIIRSDGVMVMLTAEACILLAVMTIPWPRRSLFLRSLTEAERDLWRSIKSADARALDQYRGQIRVLP
ncbi:MAG TPA: hypothetical protein VFA91_04895 [Candidatus Polarisedimenticolia bacterium]|nr:hypothetical protein [Candidatus Polarisedimenticolia bacterium]